jgi:hypothetical protein
MNTNFIAIGRIPTECIFIHKNDLIYIIRDKLTHKVKCIAIDFVDKRISEPVIIDILLRFCPHTDINSDGERSVINDLVIHYFSDSEINALNRKFERIKYSKRQTGKDTGYLSEEPLQAY